MILGGVLITMALCVYIFHIPKLPTKGSLKYYKTKWRQVL